LAKATSQIVMYIAIFTKQKYPHILIFIISTNLYAIA